MIHDLIDAWCQTCNQTLPHFLHLKIGGSTKAAPRQPGQPIVIPVRALLNCMECRTQYELVPAGPEIDPA